jgi:putative photosynthetic complex assembly protein 2
LAHLSSHFRRTTVNPIFPLSITALCFATACWMERAMAAQTEGHLVGFTLLAVLTALALLEHWFMVLPLPDQKLWRWMLPKPRAQSSAVLAAAPVAATGQDPTLANIRK